jgi:hypothetical protein
VLAGFGDDDMVRAYSRSGQELWHFKTEVDPSYKVGNRYRAPWFSDPGYDPGSRYKNRGVYAILVDDLWGNGQEEIVIGRPVTLEFHKLNGDLIKRLPTAWATNTTLALLKNRGEAKPSRLLLAGKFDGGTPNVTVVNSEHRNISNGYFPVNRVIEGCTRMDAWGQHGHGDLVVDDLDNDGIEEVIATISGHWNDLRVWNGGTQKPPYQQNPLWMKYFGPGNGGWNNVKWIPYRFMAALEIMDLNGDGRKEIIVGLKNGWIHAYDHMGKNVLSHFFHSAVRCMDSAGNSRLLVGLADGRIYLISDTDKILLVTAMDSSVERIAVDDSHVIAATQNGAVVKFILE